MGYGTPNLALSFVFSSVAQRRTPLKKIEQHPTCFPFPYFENKFWKTRLLHIMLPFCVLCSKNVRKWLTEHIYIRVLKKLILRINLLRTTGGRLPVGAENFSLRHRYVQTGSAVHPESYPVDTGGEVTRS